jgi:uncharacterized protein YggE
VVKRFGIAALAAIAALAVAGVVGSASGQLPATSPTEKTITVNGVGYGGTVATASTVAARAETYRAALSAAMDDARAKADAIAEKAGLRVTAVNQAGEEGSAADCSAPRSKGKCSMVARVTVEYAVA